MDNDPDEDLYDPKELQVLSIRSNLHYVDLFLISLYACPLFTKSIKQYVETKFKIPILSKLINNEVNKDKIKEIFLEIINNYGPFKYYEFVFLLFYVIYHKAKLLNNKNICLNCIIFCNELICTCLAFYYLSKISYFIEKIDYNNIFKHKLYDLSLDIIFDEDYFMDFIEQNDICDFGQVYGFKIYTNIFRTFVNFLRDAAQFDKEVSNISNLFGDVIYHFDLYIRLWSQLEYNFAYEASKILIVISNTYSIPHILQKYKNTESTYVLKFPEFINIRVQINEKNIIVKWLRYVLVAMYFTIDDNTGYVNNKDNIIARFYNRNNKKYFRINWKDRIECNNNEKLHTIVSEITTNTPSIYNKCDDFQDFDKYAIMCIYHAYKWL